jgi:integrase/recombinase XerD
MKAYLETFEISLLVDSADNLRDRLLIQLLFHLGCRISEALAIAIENIDLEKGIIMIQHLKTRLKLACPQCGMNLGRSHCFCPKCGTKVREAVSQSSEHRKMRVLPVDESTLSMLRQYISEGGPVTRHGKLLLFGINRHRAWQIVRECAEKARLPKLINPESGKSHNVSPHKLRDAFAIHAMKVDDSGEGMRLLQEHLGHASFNTTAKYRKIASEEHKAWYERLWQQKESN